MTASFLLGPVSSVTLPIAPSTAAPAVDAPFVTAGMPRRTRVPSVRGRVPVSGDIPRGGSTPSRLARRSTGQQVPLALAGVLLLAALLVAPEQPWDQEAICQRHAGVEACRVW